ncbi:MAG: phage tail tape measure protein [Pseudomonadota bacterium]
MPFNEPILAEYRADTGHFLRGTNRVEARLDRYERGTINRLNRVDRRWERSARSIDGVGRAIGGLLATTALVQFGRTAARVAGDFEAVFLRIGALPGVVEGDLRGLSEAARRLGRDTIFSASQAAGAIETLIKNGVSVADILGGALDASVTLAAALGGDLAGSADLATDAMLQFNLAAQDLPSVADLIAGGAANSKFAFDDFRLAFGQAGAVAAQAGVSIEEFVTAIAGTSAAFASGSDAGTSFKTFITSLTGNSATAEAAIKDLGLEFFTASGELRPLGEVAGELQRALSDLSEEAQSEALKDIFGTDALRSAAQLSAIGAEGFRDLSSAIGELDAAEQAEARMQGLNGALARVSAAFEELLISLGDGGGLDAATAAAEGLAQAINFLAENLDVAGAGVLALAGSRGFGALSRSIAQRQAEMRQLAAAAAAELASAQRRLHLAQVEQRQAQQQIALLQTQGASEARLAAARGRQTAAINASTVAYGNVSRATQRLAVAQRGLSLAAAVSTRAMVALRGAMAFFGGPIGLAITAVTVGVFALADATDEAVDAAAGYEQGIGGLESALGDLERAAVAYAKAVRGTADAQSASTASIVADSKREFEAKKELLRLELERQQALQATRRAEQSSLQSQADELSVPITVRPGMRGGNQPLADRLDASRQEELEGVSRRLREVSANAELADIAIQKVERVLQSEFTDIAGGAGGGGEEVGDGSGGGGGSGRSSSRGGGRSRTRSDRDLIGEARARAEALDEEASAIGRVREEVLFLEERRRLLDTLEREGRDLSAERLQQIEIEAAILATKRARVDDLRAAEELLKENTLESASIEERRLEIRRELEQLLPALIELTGSEIEAQEALAAAVKRANGELEETSGVGEEVGSSLSRAFEDVVTNIDNAGDALKRLGVQLAKIAIQSVATPLLESVLSGIGPALGFMSGGFTGGSSPRDVRGVVHGQEFVFDAPTTRRFPGLFDAIHSGNVRSPADLVSAAPAAPSVAPRAPRMTQAQPVSFNPTTILQIDNSGGDDDALMRRLEPELDRRDRETQRIVVERVGKLNRQDPAYLGGK